MKKLILCLLCSTFLLTACSLNKTKNLNQSNLKQESLKSDDKKDVIEEDKKEVSDNTSEEEKVSLEVDMEDINEEVKDYIINRQDDKPEANKIKWSKNFLNEVNIEPLYNEYILSGGNSEDLEAFANYITLNSPISENWQELFEKDLFDAYGEKVVRLGQLKDDLYQAYIEKDDKEIPYVVVSSRTGYFHG